MRRINVTPIIFEGPSGPNSNDYGAVASGRASSVLCYRAVTTEHSNIEHSRELDAKGNELVTRSRNYPCGRGNSAISDA